MPKASEDQLSELHSKFAEHLCNVLQGSPTAADLSVIRQFLKDNTITSDIGSNPDMDGLAKEMPSVDELDNMTIGSQPYHH